MPWYRAKVRLTRPDIGGMDTTRIVDFEARDDSDAQARVSDAARSGGYAAYRVKTVLSLQEVS